MTTKKGLIGVLMAGALTFGIAGTASANGDPPPPAKVKCNSGRGNGSETTPATDCDPGKSGLVNNGGD